MQKSQKVVVRLPSIMPPGRPKGTMVHLRRTNALSPHNSHPFLLRKQQACATAGQKDDPLFVSATSGAPALRPQMEIKCADRDLPRILPLSPEPGKASYRWTTSWQVLESSHVDCATLEGIRHFLDRGKIPHVTPDGPGRESLGQSF
jgi:hypothetical protein